MESRYQRNIYQIVHRCYQIVYRLTNLQTEERSWHSIRTTSAGTPASARANDGLGRSGDKRTQLARFPLIFALLLPTFWMHAFVIVFVFCMRRGSPVLHSTVLCNILAVWYTSRLFFCHSCILVCETSFRKQTRQTQPHREAGGSDKRTQPHRDRAAGGSDPYQSYGQENGCYLDAKQQVIN